MVETFEHNLDRRIMRLVKDATAHLHTSLFDDIDAQHLDGPQIIRQVQKIMDRKVDRTEFEEILRYKTSKDDTEMAMRSIGILREQILSTV